MTTTLQPDRARFLAELGQLEPRTPAQLHRFVQRFLGLRVPRRAIVAGHQAPMDYLSAAFFDDRVADRADAHRGHDDLIVWASRGGGKTMLGAVATLVDMIFKPGISICILGGSAEQSSRMFQYLYGLLERPALAPLLAAEPTQREIRLINGSHVRLLTQSPRSVRGHHVHKLRCDEVDEFRDHIWQAVQLMPRSGPCGGRMVRGSIEAISTMHKPYGPMNRLIERAAATGSARLIRWCALDVIERCPSARPCETCPIQADCQGRAKEAEGFMAVDDVIAHWRRSSDTAWAAEMMCRRPTVRNQVFPRFDPTMGGVHVMGASLPVRPGESGVAVMVGGMDFGIRDPFVMLWARVSSPKDMTRESCAREDLIVEVVDEHLAEGMTMDENLAAMEQRGWPRPRWIGADPSGAGRNRQTGASDIDIVRRRGYRVRQISSRVEAGIEMIRRRLDRGTLRVDPRCRELIRSLATYHFDADNPGDPRPMKDGPDHACDALRYLIVNLEAGGNERVNAKAY